MQRIAQGRRARKAGGGGGQGRGPPRDGKKARWPRVYVSSVIDAPAATGLGARARLQRAAALAPGASRESRIENGEPADKVGCVRDFRLQNGDRMREKLLGLSDYDMFCTYSILESPMPLTNYVATLRLTPVTDGDRTFAEWTAEFDCAPEREAEELVDRHRERCLPGAASTRSSGR